jgi:hypothetical protein
VFAGVRERGFLTNFALTAFWEVRSKGRSTPV